MKTKTTIKYVKNSYSKIFRYGYCDLQFIMRGYDATYYNAGIYGWNCDIYTDAVRDIAITTGYRNMAGIAIPDEIIKKYTAITKDILQNQFVQPYEEIAKALEENRNNFFNEINTLYEIV